MTSGNGSLAAVGTLGGIVSSQDGLLWSQRETDTIEILNDAAFGQNQFVVVGDSGTILTSSDSRTWLPTRRARLRHSTRWRSTAVPGSLSVTRALLRSTDAVNWASQTTGLTENLVGVVATNGGWVALGAGGTKLQSSDGIRWTATPPPTPIAPPSSLGFGNGLFVAVSPQGFLWSSPDALNWTVRLQTTNAFSRVVFANGLFVAVGSHGTLISSLNGIDWTTHAVRGC